MNTYKVLFYGEVQGVGFRWYCKELCQKLHVDGFVCNKLDGSVKLVIKTNEEMLNRIINLLDVLFKISKIDVKQIDARVSKGFYIAK